MQNFYQSKKGRYSIPSVGLEQVDQAVTDYFDKKLALSVDTERDRAKVPIIFATGERWKLIRDNKGLRDKNGTLILPLITIRRTDIERTPGFGGLAQEVPYITVSSEIHPKTSNLQNLLKTRRDNKYFPATRKDKVIREYLTIPYPDFATIFYEIIIWTQYQTQMNEILEKIFYNYDHRDSFVMPVEYDGNKPKGEGYYFVGFREGIVSSQSNVEELTDQERIIKYLYTIKTPVYLIMDPKDEALSYGKNRDATTSDGKKVLFKQQNAVDIKLKEEVLSLEDFEKKYGLFFFLE